MLLLEDCVCANKDHLLNTDFPGERKTRQPIVTVGSRKCNWFLFIITWTSVLHVNSSELRWYGGEKRGLALKTPLSVLDLPLVIFTKLLNILKPWYLHYKGINLYL